MAAIEILDENPAAGGPMRCCQLPVAPPQAGLVTGERKISGGCNEPLPPPSTAMRIRFPPQALITSTHVSKQKSRLWGHIHQEKKVINNGGKGDQKIL